MGHSADGASPRRLVPPAHEPRARDWADPLPPADIPDAFLDDTSADGEAPWLDWEEFDADLADMAEEWEAIAELAREQHADIALGHEWRDAADFCRSWFSSADDRDAAMRPIHEHDLRQFAADARTPDDAPSLTRLLAGMDQTTVSTPELVGAIDGWDRLISWATAGRYRAIAELHARHDRPDVPEDGFKAHDHCSGGHGTPDALDADTLTSAEVGPLLGLTPAHARRLVEDAVMIGSREFSRTATALARGQIDPWRTRIVTEELAEQPADVVATVHDRLFTRLGVFDDVPTGTDMSAAGATSVTTRIRPITRVPHATTLRRRIRSIITETAPSTAEQLHRREVDRRRVEVRPAPAGMAWLEAYLTAEDAIAVKTCLDQIAVQMRRHDGATAAESTLGTGVRARSADQRRADALVMLAWSALHTGSLDAAGCEPCPCLEPRADGRRRPYERQLSHSTELDTSVRHDVSIAEATRSDGRLFAETAPQSGGWPFARFDRFGSAAAMRLGTAQGRPVTVNVTMSVHTLLGLDDDPCELDGYGTITAPAARALLGQATMRRLMTDPVEGVVRIGRTRYKPTQELVDLVTARDRTCRFPGCSRPAHYCDIDHTVAYREGGSTDEDNLGTLCRTHHRVKHHAGWTLTRLKPGMFVWVTPAGRVYGVCPGDDEIHVRALAPDGGPALDRPTAPNSEPALDRPTAPNSSPALDRSADPDSSPALDRPSAPDSSPADATARHARRAPVPEPPPF